MNQDFNHSNRFIFTDSFYDHLDSSFSNAEEFEKKELENKNSENSNKGEINFGFIPNHENVKQENNPSIGMENELKPFSFLSDSDQEISSSKEEKNSNIFPPLKKEPEQKDTDTFTIDSGINEELENELLFQKESDSLVFPTSFSNSEEKQPERTVYRATRNSNSIVPTWLEQDEKENSVSPKLPEKITFPQEEELIPPIIDIDEKLKEDYDSFMEQENHMYQQENLVVDSHIVNNNLLERLRENEKETKKISILARYGEDFCSKDYITNPAIGREKEIKELSLILLTPEKSAVLVGKPGIGKTSIVEGLAYQIQRNNVPDLLKEYRIISIKTTSLIGTLPNGETRLQTLIDELKNLDHIILFMDEIHMLISATNEYGLDFANMFKESLGRGSIKMIGATTSDEYEKYILSDKAFVRRFQKVDILEPNRQQTIQILMGSLPKIEKNTSARLKYNSYIQTEIMTFLVDITTEYKRVYGIGSRYPDICLTLLAQAFSQAIFHNRKEVTIFDVRNAIENSKNIYPDVIQKELIRFDEKFQQIMDEEQKIKNSSD